MELVIGEARGVDPSQRVIRVGSETISYDWLVLASGAEMRFDLANAETFFTLDAAERLYSVLREFRGGTVAGGRDGPALQVPKARPPKERC